jgi:hypothetical protein
VRLQTLSARTERHCRARGLRKRDAFFCLQLARVQRSEEKKGGCALSLPCTVIRAGGSLATSRVYLYCAPLSPHALRACSRATPRYCTPALFLPEAPLRFLRTVCDIYSRKGVDPCKRVVHLFSAKYDSRRPFVSHDTLHRKEACALCSYFFFLFSRFVSCARCTKFLEEKRNRTTAEFQMDLADESVLE